MLGRGKDDVKSVSHGPSFLALSIYSVIESARVWIENGSYNQGNIQRMLFADLRKAHRGVEIGIDFVMELVERMEDMAQDDRLSKANLMSMGI